eukprot:3568561-Pyramimonas_sp.AAC.1
MGSLWPSPGRASLRADAVGGPRICLRGVIAGCSMAATFIRAFCQGGRDSLPTQPSLDLGVYIDDQGVSCTGPSRGVIRYVVDGAKALHSVVESCFGCSLALDNAAVVAPPRAKGDEASFGLSHLGGKFTSSAANLGVDCAAGRALRVQGRSFRSK